MRLNGGNKMTEKRLFTLTKDKDNHRISFHAMASPCEILIQTPERTLASLIADAVSQEVWRIEAKYSRYNPLSLCSKINNSNGQVVAIDAETYLLLNFADQCYRLSAGLFDISSGVLSKVWRFNDRADEKQRFPTQGEINTILAFVGWEKVFYDDKCIMLPPSMALDFGGIGKEYAVDRAILLVKKMTEQPTLVNLGGDLAVTGPRLNSQAWQVAIEPISSVEPHQQQDMIIALHAGALATSGDARRYFIKDNIRYCHVLNAKTGWPIQHAPRSITTVAPQCTQAGVLATLALLQGKNAEDFLIGQDITFWVRR